MSSKNSKASQKTDIKPLFFDRNKIIFLEFDLEKTKTCKEIYKALNKEIEKKIKELYKNIQKEINFNFIMIYSKLSNKFDNSTLTEFKLDMTFILTDLLQTNQYNLFYLPEINNDIKRDIKLKLKEKKNDYANKKSDDYNTNNNNEFNIEQYLSNEGIYYFDKKNAQFIYCKGSIDEEKIIISNKKTNIEILINQIKKDNYFENTIPLSLQVFEIKCPNYIFEIRQNNTTHILGLFKQKSYILWKNAISSAKIKNRSRRIDTRYITDINKNNYSYYTNCHSIPSKCLIINQILGNPQKRQIFLEEFDDKKISDITSNIFGYKTNVKNKEYIGALACLKQINFYIDFDNIENAKLRELEIEKYKNIITKERIEYYKSILKKVNDIFTSSINNGEDINKTLEDVFKEDLFDSLYFQIYDLFILPFFLKLKETLQKEYSYNQKPVIVKKLHLLLSKYTMNYTDMKDINNFNCLCSNNTSDMDSNMNNIRNNSNENIPNNPNDISDDNSKNIIKFP